MNIRLYGALGQGKFAIISPEDYPRVSKYKWWIKQTFNKQYIKSYKRINGKQKFFTLHRFILNPKPNEEIDHINGDPFDNRRENLRICTTAQNVRNVPKRKDNRHQYKGTIFVKRLNRWRARIQIKGKRLSTPNTFKTEREAAIAFNEMAILYHGRFARLNVVI